MPREDRTFTAPGGGQYTLLAAEPEVFTVTTKDGRVVRMFVADVLAFADFIRAEEPCGKCVGCKNGFVAYCGVLDGGQPAAPARVVCNYRGNKPECPYCHQPAAPTRTESEPDRLMPLQTAGEHAAYLRGRADGVELARRGLNP